MKIETINLETLNGDKILEVNLNKSNIYIDFKIHDEGNDSVFGVLNRTQSLSLVKQLIHLINSMRSGRFGDKYSLELTKGQYTPINLGDTQNSEPKRRDLLESGNIVEFRNKDIALYVATHLGGFFLPSRGGGLGITQFYDEQLINFINSELDVIQIYEVSSHFYFSGSRDNFKLFRDCRDNEGGIGAPPFRRKIEVNK